MDIPSSQSNSLRFAWDLPDVLPWENEERWKTPSLVHLPSIPSWEDIPSMSKHFAPSAMRDTWRSELTSNRPWNTIEQAAFVPSQDLIAHAALADAAYELLPSSATVTGYSAAERLTQLFSDQKFQAQAGSGWRLVSINGKYFQNTHQFAAENPYTGQVIVVNRGSVELLKDWIGEDVGGYLGMGTRMRGAASYMEAVMDYAKSKGYTVSTTGHSLGGSIASSVAGLFQVPVYTFNAPELRHTLGNVMTGRHYNSHQALHVRKNFDLVSVLGGRPYLARGDHAVTLDGGFNPIDAHSMKGLLSDIDIFSRSRSDSYIGDPNSPSNDAHLEAQLHYVLNGDKVSTFQGHLRGFSHSYSERRDDLYCDINIYDSKSGADGAAGYPLTGSDAAGYIADTYHDRATIQPKVHLITYRTSDGNLFFTKATTTQVYIDPQTGKVLDVVPHRQYALSLHSISAFQGATGAAGGYAAYQALAKGQHVHLSDLSRVAGKAFLQSFAGSVLHGQLEQLPGLSTRAAIAEIPLVGRLQADALGALAHGAVSTAFHLLHGDNARAAQHGLESLATAALQYGTGLPLYFGRQRMSYTSNLWSGGQLQVLERRDQVGLSIALPGGLSQVLGSLGAGVVHSKFEELSYRHGVRKHAVSHLVGGSGTAGPISIQIGLQGGVERWESDEQRVHDRDGIEVIRKDWGELTYDGQLTMRVFSANRAGTLRLLPAWSSTSLSHRSEWRADHQPFETHDIQAEPINNNEARGGENLPSMEEIYGSNSSSSLASEAARLYAWAYQDLPLSSGSQGDASSAAGSTQAPSGFTTIDYSHQKCRLEGPSADPHGGDIAVNPTSAQQWSHSSGIHEKLMKDTGTKEYDLRKDTDTAVNRKYWGVKKHTSEKEYMVGEKHVSSANQHSSTDAETGLTTIESVRTVEKSTYSDLRRETSKKRRIARKNKVNTKHYAHGEKRVYEKYEGKSKFVAKSTFKADGSALREYERVETGEVENKTLDTVYEDLMLSDDTSSVKQEMGVSTSSKHSTSTQHLDGGLELETHEWETSQETYIDTREETKNGATNVYGPGENRHDTTTLWQEHRTVETKTAEDGSALKTDCDLGKQQIAGRECDTTMDVYATRHDETRRTVYEGEKATATTLAVDSEIGTFWASDEPELLSETHNTTTHTITKSEVQHGFAGTATVSTRSSEESGQPQKDEGTNVTLGVQSMTEARSKTTFRDDNAPLTTQSAKTRAGGSTVVSSKAVYYKREILQRTVKVKNPTDTLPQDALQGVTNNNEPEIGRRETVIHGQNEEKIDAVEESQFLLTSGGVEAVRVEHKPRLMPSKGGLTGTITEEFECGERKFESHTTKSIDACEHKDVYSRPVAYRRITKNTKMGWLKSEITVSETTTKLTQKEDNPFLNSDTVTKTGADFVDDAREAAAAEAESATTTEVKTEVALSPGAGRACSTIGGTCFNMIVEGKVKKKSLAEAAVSTGESYTLGQVGAMARQGSRRALGVCAGVAAAATLGREAIRYCSSNKKGREVTMETIKRASGEAAISVATTAIQVASKSSVAGLVAGTVGDTARICYHAYLSKDRGKWAEAGKSVAVSTVALGGGMAAASAASAVGTAVAATGVGAVAVAAAPALAVAAAGCFVTGIAYAGGAWLGRKAANVIFSWWSRKKSRKELNSLFAKYGLNPETPPTEKTLSTLRRNLSKRYHPDKGGSTEGFQDLIQDFDRIFSLRQQLGMDKKAESNIIMTMLSTFLQRAKSLVSSHASYDSKEVIELIQDTIRI